MDKVAVYTAIYGAYDTPKPLPDLGVPAYLYTDNPHLQAPGWQVRVVRHGIATLKGDPRTTGPMLAHKWWKTHPELACPDADITLWLDGSMVVTVGDYVARCLAALGGDDWACVRHPWRTCVFDEGEYSATLTWRYDTAVMLAQVEQYRAINHPRGWGLIATGANVRRHTPEVVNLSHQWWDECVNWSHQDQLSLPVLLRLADGRVRWNMNLPWHEWWELVPHGG